MEYMRIPGWNGLEDDEPQPFEDILDMVYANGTIFDAFVKARSVLQQHPLPVASVSGGSDCDIMVDMLHRLDSTHKIRYVWFDTGLEYEASKEHLDWMEGRYNIHIDRIKAAKSIPHCVHDYGQPFISKLASEFIDSLQCNGFRWENKPLDELMRMYPDMPPSSLKWWTNDNTYNSNCVKYNKYLKEFMTEHPPTFKISSKCCTYAKKRTAKHIEGATADGADLRIIGTRKAEGGVRSGINTCYTSNKGKNIYRPLFWFKEQDKRDYERIFGITHSACYTLYGLKRTGCVGCPFNRNCAEELDVISQFEPKLYRIAKEIFKDSYEYTRQYREFCAEMRKKNET